MSNPDISKSGFAPRAGWTTNWTASVLLGCSVMLTGCEKVPTWGELSGQTAEPEVPVVVAPTPVAPPAPPAPPPPPQKTPAELVAEFQSRPSGSVSDATLSELASDPSVAGLISEINAQGSGQLSDAGLAALSGLTALKSINLMGTAIGDEGCKNLALATSLESVKLSGTKVTDAGVLALGQLPQLKVLHLNQTKLTPAGYEVLGNYPQLEEVWLDYSSINDAGMVALGRATSLKRLKLMHTGITDAGLAELKDLKQLEYLDISYTGIADEGLPELEKAGCLDNIKFLSVQATRIGDKTGTVIAGLKSLEGLDLGMLPSMQDRHLVTMTKGLKQLKRLNLFRSSGVTGAGLIGLRKHPALEELMLDGGLPGIDDSALIHLVDIKTLRKLNVHDTRVSQFGVQKLKKAIPGLEVTGVN